MSPTRTPVRTPVLAVVLLACLLGLVPAGAGAAPVPAAATAGPLPITRAPELRGTLRYGSTLRVRDASYGVQPAAVSYRWLRDGVVVDGATARTYVVRPDDVGARLVAEVMASAPGYDDTVAVTPRRAVVRHRRGVGRTVTYHVETRGRTTASTREFARLAQETYDDPRGWRGAGIRFVRVARGGSFTLVLATPEEVPRFSVGCSATYSCRVGRFVIINQARWLGATPPWNAAGGTLRDYRHLVVDHETGHWLGLDHAGCPRPGALAPVMMQQSKGLDGCRYNPFPTLGEQASRAPRRAR